MSPVVETECHTVGNHLFEQEHIGITKIQTTKMFG